MRPRVVVDRRDTLVETLIDRLASAARHAVRSRNRFALAVPGGSVAEALFPKLGGAALDWERTHVFWVDERAVPPDHPDSNAGRARSLWLDRVPIRPENLHRMRGESADLEAAAREAEEDLVRALGQPPRLDIAVLGVGPDGHVASLFPAHASLCSPRLVVALTDAPKPPSRRLTMTLRALGAARELWIAAFGAEKAGVVSRATAAAAGELPASPAGADAPSPVELVAASGPPVTFFLDPEAAARLPP